MQKWKINLDLKVSDNWVADGVNFSDPDCLKRLEEHIRNFMPYAYYEIEFKVEAKVTSAPKKLN